jgi:hypothetical protein
VIHRIIGHPSAVSIVENYPHVRDTLENFQQYRLWRRPPPWPPRPPGLTRTTLADSNLSTAGLPRARPRAQKFTCEDSAGLIITR